METDVADAAIFQSADDYVVRARPLAEHHRFRVRLHEDAVEQRRQFVGLDAVVGFLVQ